jgi:hypothetical protein
MFDLVFIFFRSVNFWRTAKYDEGNISLSSNAAKLN